MFRQTNKTYTRCAIATLRESVSGRDSLSREIQEYCSSINEHHQYEREMHYVMLDSMKEHKERQRQQGRKEKEEVYKADVKKSRQCKRGC